MVRTGSSVYLQYGAEVVFGGGATQTRVFGLEQKLTGVTWKNNQIPLGQLNNVEIGCFAYGKNEGSGSVEFVLSTPWIFDVLLSGNTDAGGASDFTHVWNSDKTFTLGTAKAISGNTAASPTVVTSATHSFATGDYVEITGSVASVPSIDGLHRVTVISPTTFSIPVAVTTPGSTGSAIATNEAIAIPNSFHMEYGHDAETGNVVRNMKGVVMKSLTLKASLGETIKGTAELNWGNEDTITTVLDQTIAADDIKFPYTFAHASLDFPDGTTVAQVQELELTFNPNTELLYGIGSANAVGAFRKLFEMTGKFKAAQVDKTQLQRVFDAADGTTANTGVGTLTVTFTNGLTTTNEKAIILEFTGVGVSEHTSDAQPGEPIFEHLSWQLRSLKVTANNPIATVP